MFRAHVLIIRRSKLYYTASGIITPIGVMIPDDDTDDKHMCSKHVEAWNKLIVKQKKMFASSWLITKINICTLFVLLYDILMMVAGVTDTSQWIIHDKAYFTDVNVLVYCSEPRSELPATGPHPETDQCSPHRLTVLIENSILILSSHVCLVLRSSIYHAGAPPNPCMHHSSPPLPLATCHAHLNEKNSITEFQGSICVFGRSRHHCLSWCKI